MNFKFDKKYLSLIFGVLFLLATIVILIVAIVMINGKNKDVDSALNTESVVEPFTKQSFAMDTYITQQIYDEDNQKAKQAAIAVEKELLNLENAFSLYKQDSEVAKINGQAGMSEVNKYKPKKEVYNLICDALKICEQSKGSFDITIAPLVKLWGITNGDVEHKVPDDSSISSILEKVNYKNVVINEDNKSVWLKKSFMSLDLGAVVKGYACEKIRDIYDEYEITSALVSVGGNIIPYGKKQTGEQYLVGLRDPFGDANDIFAKISVEDKIISTTGKYERYFEQDGEIYHHILDTKTGYPINNELESVTVISNNGTLADCLSTTIFTKGIDEVIKQIEAPTYKIDENDTFSIIAVDKDKNVYASEDIKQSITLIHGFKWGE